MKDYVNYIIADIFDNYRVEDYLIAFHLAKVKIAKYRLPGTIKINDSEAIITSCLKKGDKLSLLIEEEVDFVPLENEIRIVYEDEHLLIIDKPCDIIVHPDDKTKTGTLVNMVASYFIKNNIRRNVRYLHRLDTQTTGLIIFAKDPLTSSYFNYLLSTHEIKRTYLAICCGAFEKQSGFVDAKIGEDRHHNQRRRISKTGQSAFTAYEAIKPCSKYYTFVKLVLKTGRTHQIRVHMQSIGHPLAGDELYGGSKKSIKRVALHSAYLDFIDPYTGDKRHFEAKLPLDMQNMIKS